MARGAIIPEEAVPPVADAGASDRKPAATIGRILHEAVTCYDHRGTRGQKCRAAIAVDTGRILPVLNVESVDLWVFPKGDFAPGELHHGVHEDHAPLPRGGTWHWPLRCPWGR